MRLYKHKNGMYYVALPGNIRKSLNTRNEREAQAKYKQLQRMALNNKLVALDRSTNITLDTFIPEFLDNKLDLTDGSIRLYIITFRQFKRSLGDVDIPLKNITLDTIADFKKWCLDRGLQKTTVNTYLLHIKAMLDVAIELKYITIPLKIKLLKVPKHLPRVLTDDEIDLILHVSPPDIKRIIQFALYTGCRLSEIIGLQWQHINNNMALVTGKGNKQRTIPLVKGAIDALGPYKNSGHVFVQLRPDTISHYFKAIARSVGIEDVHFHNLRHSAATQMLTCGIAIPVVQNVLGHSEITTTFVYAKVVDPLKISEMQKLNYPDLDVNS